MPKRKKIKVIERKLGREKAMGQAWMGEDLIEIDNRLNNKEYLFCLLHEVLHICFPNLSEKEVLKYEKVFGKTVWEQGYRRIHK